jgi:Leishmanolysin
MRDSSNGGKIDFVKNEILPRAAAFWSQALAVVPVSGNLRISTGELDNREYCGDFEFSRVPAEHISTGVEGADLILYVSGTPSSRFCSYQTLVSATKATKLNSTLRLVAVCFRCQQLFNDLTPSFQFPVPERLWLL